MRRKQLLQILVLWFFPLILMGCATPRKSPKFVPKAVPIQEEQILAPDSSPELVNIEEEELKQYAISHGVIIAKTDFQGVLKTRYVKLLFEHQENGSKFQLHIGDRVEQQQFPWEVKMVEPGYFFIELPAGPYEISSLAIPVGSTMAEESMKIALEVIPNAMTYIGTLKVIGTKEKIKLGGLPVIKPGFEYTVEILDEQQEGITAFRQQYPTIANNIEINIMKVVDQ